jgi:micrococcal nuclease
MERGFIARIGAGRRHGRPRRPRAERRRRREAIGRAAFVMLVAATGFMLGVLWSAPVWGQPLGSAPDRETARFALCGAQGIRAARVTCVVDGDTFWYRGAKIRVADINTPETSAPACPHEAALGEAATLRLAELLNAGPFTLAPWTPDRDRYGRLLRTVTRAGESLGAVLVREGLAEEWRGRRGSWC